jgi:DNA-binding SARP family transcriptional activator/WD40 repeat protein
MGIGVLGPVVSDGGVAFGRRDRAVLTALSLRVGQPVSEDQLIEAVWGSDPPRSAHKSLQGCVFRIRQALGSDVIRTSPQGYALTLPSDEVDARRFERLVGRGRELLALGEPDRAAYLLGEALALWRGTPFQDVELSDLAAIEAERLEELRREAEELRVEASLRTGRHLEVLATAEAMVRSAPLRERRWQLLAQAQYQAGRQTEALRTVHRVKRVLAEQLGIDPGPDLAALEEAILRQDDSLLSGVPVTSTGACPYRGLLPFDLDDHEAFFGRDDDVRACLDILRERGAVSVVGPSGSGKSSLARAGIAAALRLQGRRITVLTPGSDPAERLATLPRPSERTVLVVDQAEEIFSLCGDESERTAFLTGLVRWSEQGRLVVAMRADRLADVSAYPDFARLLERSLYLLGAMTEAGLRAAIEAPARQSGLLIEPGLVDVLVGEVAGTAGALPLLSHALLETWQRREANTLTVEGYTASGGIRGAVAQSAETVYAGIAPEQRTVLRDLVLRLVSSGTQGEPVRAKLPRRLFSQEPEHQQLIDLLVGSRLVTSDAGVVEIAHEALARAWPRLRTWLDEDLEGQRIRQHLTSAADAWETLGRPDSELYRGIRLAQALQWRERADTRLTATEVEFLDAGDRNEQSERRSEQARAKAQARLIRRLRAVLAVAVVLLVVALAAGLTAFQQRDRAEDNAAAATRSERRSEARRAGASALITDDLEESMLLAVAGVRLDDSPETRSSLLSALSRHPEAIASTELSGEEVLYFDVSPDGTTVATYDLANRVRLYDLSTGESLAEFQAGEPAALQWVSGKVRFSPDGSILAVTTAAPTRRPLVLLDTSDLEPLAAQPGGTGWARWQLNNVHFSKDGRRLAAVMWRVRGHEDTTQAKSTWVYVWDMSTLDEPVFRRIVASEGVSAPLTENGDAFFTTGPLTRHDVATGRSEVLPEPWGEGSVEIAQMSPTGQALGVSGVEVGVAVLDPRTGRVRRQMQTEEGDFPYYLSFSDDGRRLSTVSERHGIVWQVESGRELIRVPLAENGEASDLAADGSTLYTAGSGGTLRQWDVDGDRRFVSQVAFAPHRLGDYYYVRPSPDGRYLAYPKGDRIDFFDVTAGTVVASVSQEPGYRRRANAQWHPDSIHFAAATDGVIRVWDARDGSLVARAQPAGRLVSALDYSTDGGRLVIGDLSGRVTMLDSTDLTPVGTPVQLDHAVRAIASGSDNRTALALIGFESASGFWVGSSPQWAKLDLDTGEVLAVQDVGFEAGQVDISPDGDHAAIGGSTGELMVLDLAAGEPVREPVTVQDSVQDLTYSSDGTRLLTSGFDSKNALWDGRTGELLARVVTTHIVTEATFTGTGDTVLIAPLAAGEVYVWNTRPEYAVEFACRVAGRDFTEQEWADHFGDRPFQPTCPGRGTGNEPLRFETRSP